MLGLERILDPHLAQNFWGEVGQTGKANRAALGQAVTNPQDAVVWDADDVTGKGLFGQLAIRRKEHDRSIDADLTAGVLHLQLHAALEPARGQAQERDPVTMVGVHIGLDLKDKAGNLRVARHHVSFSASAQGLQRLGRRRIGPKAREKLIHPEMAQG